MRAALHRDDADAVGLRHVDGFLDRAHADDEAEPIVTVERGCDRRDAVRLQRRVDVDQFLADAVEVDRNAAEAVCVDAAQVGMDEASCDGRCILVGQVIGA